MSINPPINPSMPGFAFIHIYQLDEYNKKTNNYCIMLVYITKYNKVKNGIQISYRFIDSDEEPGMRTIQGFNPDDELQTTILKRNEIFFLPSEYNTILANFALPSVFWEFPTDFSDVYPMFPHDELIKLTEYYNSYIELQEKIIKKKDLKKETNKLNRLYSNISIRP